jgi:polysaccharide biosynthesis/export protein
MAERRVEIRKGAAIARTVCFAGLAAVVGLPGCAQLPVSGPNSHVIGLEATSGLQQDRRTTVMDYVLLDISQPVLQNVADVTPDSFFRTFGTGTGAPSQNRVGVGDVVSISIFESSAGGLFSPGDIGSRPGAAAVLPSQTVDPGGFIRVPYAGKIRASGRTIEQVQKEIETLLTGRAIEPQVLLSLTDQPSSEVAVFGDAVGNTKAKLRAGGDRVLDILAKVGVRQNGTEVFVTLLRQGRKSTVYLPRLINEPSENIFVKPGDVIYAYRDPQRFVAVGALGNTGQTQGVNGLLTFDSERLSLVEAISKAGGLIDSRAGGQYVFVYRLEYREVLERIGVPLPAFPPGQKLIPTVYRANYRDPSIFFFAEQFPVRNRDVIYVANADAIEVDKLFAYVRLFTGTAAGISGDILSTRTSLRALGQ